MICELPTPESADETMSDLRVFAATSLDPLFWKPEHLEAPGEWSGHVPFAHWLVSTLRPRAIVNLSNVSGTSQRAFCRAVARSGLATRCYTLQPPDADEQFRASHDDRYGGISVLLDTDTEAPSDQIGDRAVGLLHLDLLAGHGATRRAVEAWERKLSNGAVLLVHGTGDRSGDVGRRREWDALIGTRPHFEFTHAGGLGVIALGAEVPDPVGALCGLTGSAMADRVTRRFGEIGDLWINAAEAVWHTREDTRRAAVLNAKVEDLQHEVAMWRRRAREEERARLQIALRLNVARRDVYAAGLRADEAKASATAAEMRAAIAAQQAKVVSDDAKVVTAANVADLAEARRDGGVLARLVVPGRKGARLRMRAIFAEFDPAYYLATYLDVRADGIDPLEHYVQHGWKEGRRPSEHFDTHQYLAANARVRRALLGSNRKQPGDGPAAPAPPTELGSRADLAEARRDGGVLARLVVPGRKGARLRMRAIFAEFDPAYYLATYLDVRADGIDPLEHYVQHGWKEGRRPSEHFDTHQYLAANARVRRALLGSNRKQPGDGPAAPAPPTELGSRAHADLQGEAFGASPGEGPGVAARAPDLVPDEGAVVEQTHQAALDLLTFLTSKSRIAFRPVLDPDLSIIVVLPEDAASVLRCLTMLERQDAPPFELLVVQRPGDERTEEVLSRSDPIRVLEIAEGDNLLQALNRAAALSHGRALLFLDDGILRPGALTAGLAALSIHGDVGAVGGRIAWSSGRLRAAGGIFWSDASLGRYGSGLDAEASEAMFRREVDFCDFPLLISQVAWQRAGEFDAGYRDPAYGLADYAMRLRRVGLRIIYDPNFVADVAVDPSRTPPMASSEAALRQSQARFRLHYETALRLTHLPPAEANLLAAREPRRAHRRRLLMIDNEVPFGSLGSGYPRAKEMLAVAAEAGWAVTLFPLHRTDFDWGAARAEISADVEIIRQRGAANLAEFLDERRGFYDVILVSRPDNMELTHRAFRDRPGALGGARLVYDAEAVFAYREVIRAELEERPYSREQIDELCLAEAQQTVGVDGVTCVSDVEAEFFRAHAPVPVYVLNHPVVPVAHPPGFESRTGFLFVGRLLEHAAPNWQGLSWFLRNCWPLVRAALPDATLTVAGHLHPDHAALEAPGVCLLGPVSDLRPCYDAARVFIAPVRFAAGVPIKILEATAAGLPVAATQLMARQLGWQNGTDIVAEDDAQALANGCVELHEDAGVWETMRTSAAARLRLEFSPDQFRANLVAALDGRPPPHRAPENSDAPL